MIYEITNLIPGFWGLSDNMPLFLCQFKSEDEAKDYVKKWNITKDSKEKLAEGINFIVTYYN